MKKLLCALLILFMTTIPVCAEGTFPEAVMDLNLISEVNSSDNVISVSDRNNNSREIEVIKATYKTETLQDSENQVEYVVFDINNASGFRLSQNDLCGLDETTIEIWAKPDADSNARELFSIARAYSTQAYYAAVKNNDTTEKPELIIYLNGETATGDISDYNGKWTHFVFTREFNEDGTAKVVAYANSKKIVELSITSENEDGTNKFFHIGTSGKANTNKDYIWKGGISEVRFYDKILSNSEIAEAYLLRSTAYGLSLPEADEEEEIPQEPADPEVILDVDFSKGITDETVTLFGLADSDIQSGFGANGETYKYITFTGTEKQYISSNKAELSNNDATTLEMWLKSDTAKTSSGGDKYIRFFTLTAGTEADTTWRTELFPAGEDTYIATAGLSGGSALVSDIVNKWAHLVFTRTLDRELGIMSYKIYLDGALIKSYTVSDVPSDRQLDAPNSTFYFGANDNSALAYNYTGAFSKIKVYNKELTKDEIEEIYNTDYMTYKTPELLSDSEIGVKAGSAIISTGANTAEDALSDGYEITFKDSGKAFYADVVANGANELLVKFNQYFKYGSVISFYSKALNTYGIINIEKGGAEANVTLRDETLTATELNGQNSLYADIRFTNSSSQEKNLKYTIVARNESGASVSAISQNITVGANTSEPITKLITVSDTKDASSLYVYVWEVDGGILKPIYGSPKIFEKK